MFTILFVIIYAVIYHLCRSVYILFRRLIWLPFRIMFKSEFLAKYFAKYFQWLRYDY